MEELDRIFEDTGPLASTDQEETQGRPAAELVP